MCIYMPISDSDTETSSYRKCILACMCFVDDALLEMKGYERKNALSIRRDVDLLTI